MADVSIEFELDGGVSPSFSQDVSELGGQLGDVDEKASGIGERLGSIFGTAQTKIQDAAKDVPIFGGALSSLASGPMGLVVGGAAAIVGGLTALIDKQKETAVELGKTSVALGVSTDALQTLGQLEKDLSIDTGTFEGAIGDLNQKLGEFAIGASGPAKQALETLGINFEDIKDKTPEEQLLAVTGALAEIPDAATRARTGNELLGGSYAALTPLLTANKDEQAALFDEATRGITLNAEQIESYELLDRTISDITSSVKNGIGRALANLTPIIVEVIKQGKAFYEESLEPIFESLTEIWETVDDFVIPILSLLGKTLGIVAGTGLKNIALALGIVADLLTGDFSGAWNGVKRVVENTVNGVVGIINGFIDTINKIPGVNITPLETVKFTEAMDNVEKEASDAGTNVAASFAELETNAGASASGIQNNFDTAINNVQAKSDVLASDFDIDMMGMAQSGSAAATDISTTYDTSLGGIAAKTVGLLTDFDLNMMSMAQSGSTAATNISTTYDASLSDVQAKTDVLATDFDLNMMSMAQSGSTAATNISTTYDASLSDIAAKSDVLATDFDIDMMGMAQAAEATSRNIYGSFDAAWTAIAGGAADFVADLQYNMISMAGTAEASAEEIYGSYRRAWRDTSAEFREMRTDFDLDMIGMVQTTTTRTGEIFDDFDSTFDNITDSAGSFREAIHGTMLEIAHSAAVSGEEVYASFRGAFNKAETLTAAAVSNINASLDSIETPKVIEVVTIHSSQGDPNSASSRARNLERDRSAGHTIVSDLESLNNSFDADNTSYTPEFQDALREAQEKVDRGEADSISQVLQEEEEEKNALGYRTGGIVPARQGGTLIRVGEGGEDEAIIPLSALDRVIGSTQSGSGPTNLNITLRIGEYEFDDLFVQVNERTKRQGRI